MTKEEFNIVVNADLFRYKKSLSYRDFLRGLYIPGFRYTYILRRIDYHKNNFFLRKFFIFLRKYYSYKYGFQIGIETKIGKGFFIGHFGTLVINDEAELGANCNIAHNVTIGQTNRGKLKGCPVIGDKVWIGTGAVIVGGITIGSDVLIAPNSFVNFNVPDDSIVIGNPGNIIQRSNPTCNYINNIL